MTDDLYRTLLIDPAADHEIIRAAYHVLARRNHPDRTSSPEATRRMVDLNRAYAVLRDPVQRRDYDRRRETNAPAAPTVQTPPPPAATGVSPFADRAQRVAQQRGTPAPNEPGPLDFGRYQGWTLSQIVRTDPDYLRWLRRHSSGIRYRRAIDEALRAKPNASPLRRAS